MVNILQAEILKTVVAEECGLNMDVVVHESIDSTNSWALQQCKTGKELPFACFAEAQTQGRGRRGKHWLLPAGANIAMSLAWTFALSYRQMNLLPLSIAVAIAETLEDFGLEEVQIKWPNDVYVQGRKISGILIESQMAGGTRHVNREFGVIIGVGLNYDMSSLSGNSHQDLPVFTDFISESKLQAINNEYGRIDVASKLLRSIVNICLNFQHDAKHNLERFRINYDFCKEKPVQLILDSGMVLEGVAQGVDEKAELRVIVDGEERCFNSADVSVRPNP